MNSLFKKFMEFAVGNIAIIILGLISTAVITRVMGTGEIGEFTNFTTITSLIVLVAMVGLDQAYIRYYHEEDEENRGKLLRQCIKIPLCINIGIGLGVLVLYRPISYYILEETSLNIVVWVLIHSTFSIISNFVLINIRMQQRGKLYSVVTAMNKVFYILGVVILYKALKANYMIVIVSFTVANIAMIILGVVLEGKDWFDFRNNKELKTDTKTLLNYGSPFIFSMAITWIFQYIDKVSINILSNKDQVGIYGVSMTIIGIMNALQAAFTTFWVPVAYEKYSTNPEDKEFFSKVNEIISIVMILIAIGLIATKDIAGLILGAEFREAVYVIPFLVFMPIMYTISETTVLGINFKKKTKYHLYIAIFSAISNIIGNVILVPRMGATGAAISTGLSYIVFFIARTYYAGKLYKIELKLGRFWTSIIAVYALATYSSLYKFNIVILALTILATVISLVMYRNIVVEGYHLFKKHILKK